MLRILITNDDGIDAIGIKSLALALEDKAEVYVVCPDSQRSGASMSITFSKPIGVRKANLTGATESWKIDGTPADCIIWALEYYEKRGIVFDYVLSGINQGKNVGVGAFYSGTVAGAREASMHGYKGIALSVSGHTSTHFEFYQEHIMEFLELADKLRKGSLLNINAPDIPPDEIKGVKITEPAPFGYDGIYGFIEEAPGYYQMHVEPGANSLVKGSFDFDAINQGYIAVTPITTELLDYNTLRNLNGLTPINSLCMFIDLQSSIVTNLTKSKKLVRNLSRFAKCVDKLAVPTLITELHYDGLGRTIDEVRKNIENAEQCPRTCFDATESSSVLDSLNNITGRKIILAGAEAHISVELTALGLIERGFTVYVLRDLISSRSEDDLTTAISRMAAAGCIITSSETLIYQMLGSVNHIAYKSINQILNEETKTQEKGRTK